MSCKLLRADISNRILVAVSHALMEPPCLSSRGLSMELKSPARRLFPGTKNSSSSV